MKIRFLSTLSLVLLIFTLLIPNDSFAAKKKGGKGAFAGGSLSAGFGISVISADQSGLNTMIHTAKSSAPGGASTSDFSSGYEFMGHFTFRFSNNLVAIQIRPAYFTQSTTGSATDGSYDYKLTGYSIFPLVRLIPLSNDIIDFYLQAGIGYGSITGDITNGAKSAKFTGGNFGLQVGLGADFCLVPDHCFGIEGNYRYLVIDRNIVSSGTGPGSLPYGSSQAQKDRELEDLNGMDIPTSMSGIAGILTYTYNF